jgi:hypothetical protein
VATALPVVEPRIQCYYFSEAPYICFMYVPYILKSLYILYIWAVITLCVAMSPVLSLCRK